MDKNSHLPTLGCEKEKDFLGYQLKKSNLNITNLKYPTSQMYRIDTRIQGK